MAANEEPDLRAIVRASIARRFGMTPEDVKLDKLAISDYLRSFIMNVNRDVIKIETDFEDQCDVWRSTTPPTLPASTRWKNRERIKDKMIRGLEKMLDDMIA